MSFRIGHIYVDLRVKKKVSLSFFFILFLTRGRPLCPACSAHSVIIHYSRLYLYTAAASCTRHLLVDNKTRKGVLSIIWRQFIIVIRAVALVRSGTSVPGHVIYAHPPYNFFKLSLFYMENNYLREK